MRALDLVIVFGLPPLMLSVPVAQRGKVEVASREVISLKWVKEEIKGDGTRGPFVLLWNRLVPGSEGVYFLGRRFLPGHDYNIDYESGILIFAKPLPRGEKVEVYYAYKPGVSRKNQKKEPVKAASYAISPELRLGVSLLPGKGGGASGAALSLSAEMVVGRGSRATAVFALSPQAGPLGASSGRLPPEAYAIRSGWATQLGALRLRAEVERVGREFRGPGRWGVRPGGERAMVATELPFLRRGGARLILERVEQAGRERLRVGFKATAPLTNRLRATLTREALTLRGSSAKDERETQEVRLEQSLGRGTKAVLALKEERKGEIERKERRIEVSASPASEVALKGRLAHGREKGGPEREEKYLEARLGGSRATLRTAIKEVEVGRAKSSVHEVETKTRVGRGIEVALSLREREAPSGRTLRSRLASVALSPSPKLRIRGSVKEAPAVTEKAMRAELRPSPSLSLFAARILREQGEETREWGMTLSPLKSAKFEVRYSRLPVRKGKVLPEERYELGLSLPLGLGWRLKGGHLRKTELPTGAVERRTELSLLKPVGGARRLRLGLSLAERIAGAGEIRSYEFMLGYVHEFTSTFGLSLEGRMRREAFGGMLSEPYYQAEMKFRLLY